MALLARTIKRKFDDLETERPSLGRTFPSAGDYALNQTAEQDPKVISKSFLQPRLDSCLLQEEQSKSLEDNPDRRSPSHLGSPADLAYIPSTRSFASDASIVLIGIRGVGKSSLGIIAFTALRRRLVDVDQYFQRAIGLSRAAFRQEHGVTEYRLRDAKEMKSMLRDNQSNCVISCGPGCIEGSGFLLLREYAKTHPVIHALRDRESIQRYLSLWDEGKVARLIEIGTPMHRACSNFEFYNLSE